MLLEVNWPHLREMVTQVLRMNGGEWKSNSGLACFGTPDREEGEDLDLEQVIGDGYFPKEQGQKPLFQNIWLNQLAKQQEEVLDPQKMKQSLCFEVRMGILYWVED